MENCVSGTVIHGNWRNEPNQLMDIQRTRAGNSTTLAKEVRDDFCEYFNTMGAIPWQNKCLE